MKKTKKIAVIVSVIMMVAGSMISAAALASVGFDISKLDTAGPITTEVFSVDSTFDSINIDVIDSNVVLELYDPDQNSSECTVECDETDNMQFTVEVWDNTLYIKQESEKKLLMFDFNFSFQEKQTVVRLPFSEYKGGTKIETVSGDIRADEKLSFSNVELETTSGDINISSSLKQSLSVSTTSGDIKLKGSKDLSDVDIETTSGDIELADFSATDDIRLSSVSGDIVLGRCLLCSADIETVSGDVSGNMIGSGYVYVTDTTSGDIIVPGGQDNAGNAHVIRITTVSGDIKIGEG